VPEASFVVAHGQLKPDVLEERILSFKEGKYLVLVSSTIIENGIDLPRANTLIVNEAERFGLAQLYQLRGRVGRSNVQAFAYLLYHSQRLRDDAKKRLRAIVEACELGSGFQVAMRDLEIRGAGEILGVSQAGTMNTVGVSHYLRMLKNAVEETEGGRQGGGGGGNHRRDPPPRGSAHPHVSTSPIPTRKFPCTRSSPAARMRRHWRSSSRICVRSSVHLPRQVRNLFAVLQLKLVCRRGRAFRVKAEESGRSGREIVLSLSPRVEATDIMRLLQVNPRWKISGSTLRIAEAELQKAGSDSSDILPELTREVKALIRTGGQKGKNGEKSKKG
jgi:transcription-repair coupling factor (superfamily II helicase)